MGPQQRTRQRSDGLGKLLGVERLDQVLVDARLHRPQHHVALGVHAQREDRHLRCLRAKLAQTLQDDQRLRIEIRDHQL
jgi:hypothetical protein